MFYIFFFENSHYCLIIIGGIKPGNCELLNVINPSLPLPFVCTTKVSPKRSSTHACRNVDAFEKCGRKGVLLSHTPTSTSEHACEEKNNTHSLHDVRCARRLESISKFARVDSIPRMRKRIVWTAVVAGYAKGCAMHDEDANACLTLSLSLSLYLYQFLSFSRLLLCCSHLCMLVIDFFVLLFVSDIHSFVQRCVL